MARKGGDIAALKEAEVQATAIVAAARDQRKALMRQAQAEAAREVDEYRARREAKLRQQQPGAAALEDRVARTTADTDRKIAALEAEYQRNKEPVLQMLMQVVMNIDNPFGKA